MARSITEIYDALALEKSTQPELAALQPDVDTAQALLSDVTTPSQVARWRFMLWVVAVGMWAHEKLWDLFKAEVDALAARSHVGTMPWYVDRALEFQYGDPLVDVDGVFMYDPVVPANQIVARAAGVESSGVIIMKVAKLSAGTLVALTNPEKTSFLAYMDDIKFAGTVLNCVTDGPDLLKVYFTVYYDPLVMLNTGALILNGAVFPVRDAINTFLANLPFNGKLVLTELVDAVQLAEGVVNPVLTNAEAKHGALPYAAISVQYLSNAGHMAIDGAFPLSTTISYVPA